MIRHTGIALLILCSMLTAACKQNTKTAPKEDSYYETLEVSLGSRTLTTGYSAAISGVQTVEIRPQVSGMITEIMIEEGESVRKGQVLFVIDHPLQSHPCIFSSDVRFGWRPYYSSLSYCFRRP